MTTRMTVHRFFMIGLVALLAWGTSLSPAIATTVRQQQWFIDGLDLPALWPVSDGGGVVVAVIDSGVEASIPPLRGQVLPGKTFGTSGDGRTDLDLSDGHGTSMAGIIAARPQADSDYSGVAPGAKILPISAENFLSEAIRYAADRGAEIINISASSGPQASPELNEAIRYAIGKDCVIVASAGNSSQGDVSVSAPANIPGVIAVGATDANAKPWQHSVRGPQVALSAPGIQIVSPVRPGIDPSGFITTDGTSDSAAIVSGVAALVRAKYPDLDAANVVNRLIRTAKDHNPPGRDPAYGFGTVHPRKALTQQVTPVTKNPLGEPPAPTPAAAPKPAANPTIQWIIIGLVVLLAAAVAAVIISFLIHRSRRRTRTPAPPTFPPGQ